ncbi:ABC transporter permease [Amycolatopsis taiwanensis]|uniref:Nitrate ABC transporter permease n=1 Tax=Amycolatopsis taiwanensis TaxID=342230 RepID=A0A9W6R6B6_9PSEU|nr:ABC transporter permease [Amycolatopsis taiwanensis]GLY69135.1 nitrate ABC transporter permease [Amycolatopsis taiwanensis]
MSGFRRLIGLVAFLLIWEAAGRSGLVAAGVLPPASEVLARFFGLFADARFLPDAASTLLSWVIALVFAAVIAVPLGMLLGSIRPLRLVIGPVIEFLRPLPTVALIPLAILVLGSGAQTKISLAAFASTWPILFNTVYAVGEIDRQLLETARVFRTPPRRLFFSVILPAVAPFVLTGIRLSAAVALIVLVSTEFLTAQIGIGHFVYLYGTTQLQMDVVFASIVFTGLIGYLVNMGLLGAQRRWLGWAAVGGAV